MPKGMMTTQGPVVHKSQGTGDPSEPLAASGLFKITIYDGDLAGFPAQVAVATEGKGKNARPVSILTGVFPSQVDDQVALLIGQHGCTEMRIELE